MKNSPQIQVVFDSNLNKYKATVVGIPYLAGISRKDYEAVELIKNFLDNFL